MKNPDQFVAELVKLSEAAQEMPLGQAPVPAAREHRANASKIILFSPHPDDEAVVGALALRLQTQSGWEVVNVAVTQGSNPARQSARWAELEACCRYLNFRLIQTRPDGLHPVNTQCRAKHPEVWKAFVSRIVEILQRERPQAIAFPHQRDWNGTHIGVHHLVMDALPQMPPSFSCHTIETEFWGAMDSPNLMVESSPEDVTRLVTGLTFHVGEVRRNPYHLRMPAWMMDNVRRGCELVGGQGGASPKFLFATLYRVGCWRAGQLTEAWAGGRFLSVNEDPETLFRPRA